MNRIIGIFGVITLVLLLGAGIDRAREAGVSLVATTVPAVRMDAER